MNNIFNTDDFDINSLWKNIINDMFKLDPMVYTSIEDIFVDLDSCLSILTNEKIPFEEDAIDKLISETVYGIAEFLDKWKNYANIRIYCNFKPTQLINNYIPDWDIERNKRLENPIVEKISMKIISKLKNISLSNIEVIEVHDSPIIFIARDIKFFEPHGDSCIVITRDLHYMSLLNVYKKLELYNGKHVVNSINYSKVEGGKYPAVPLPMISYYYAFVGLPRHQYKGIKLFGDHKGTKILNNIDECKAILSGNHNLLEKVGEAVKVFTEIHKFSSFYDNKVTKEVKINSKGEIVL